MKFTTVQCECEWVGKTGGCGGGGGGENGGGVTKIANFQDFLSSEIISPLLPKSYCRIIVNSS